MMEGNLKSFEIRNSRVGQVLLSFRSSTVLYNFKKDIIFMISWNWRYFWYFHSLVFLPFIIHKFEFYIWCCHIFRIQLNLTCWIMPIAYPSGVRFICTIDYNFGLSLRLSAWVYYFCLLIKINRNNRIAIERFFYKNIRNKFTLVSNSNLDIHLKTIIDWIKNNFTNQIKFFMNFIRTSLEISVDSRGAWGWRVCERCTDSEIQNESLQNDARKITRKGNDG